MFNNITFILHKPQLSENIGACARAMKNFNLSKMVLISPKPIFPNDKIIATSVGAQDIIKKSKIYEELEELKLGIQKKDQDNIEEEIGDLLIGVVNLSRFLNVSAEVAMQKSNRKFYRRFTRMEKLIENDDKEIDKLSLEELDNYWNKVKNEEQ